MRRGPARHAICLGWLVLALLAGCADDGPGSHNWASLQVVIVIILGVPLATAPLLFSILLRRRLPTLAPTLLFVAAGGFFGWGAKTAWEGRARMARFYFDDPSMRTSDDEDAGRRGYANVRVVLAEWGLLGVGLAAVAVGLARASRTRSAPVIGSAALAATGIVSSLVVLVTTIPPARSARSPREQRVVDESILVLRARDRELELRRDNRRGLDLRLLFHDSHCASLKQAVLAASDGNQDPADRPLDLSRLLPLSPSLSRAACLCPDQDLRQGLVNARLPCDTGEQ
jgi:hypothetical protein